jgi:hypothetical protein
MAEQTQPIDRKYTLSVRLGMMAQLALERGDVEQARELSTASHEALREESLARENTRQAQNDEIWAEKRSRGRSR